MEHRKHSQNIENVLVHIVGASWSTVLPREVLFKLGLRISRTVLQDHISLRTIVWTESALS